MKNGTKCLFHVYFNNLFVELPDPVKHNKRHAESKSVKPGVHVSGTDACVLLTADERTTGLHYCIDISDCVRFIFFCFCVTFILSTYDLSVGFSNC